MAKMTAAQIQQQLIAQLAAVQGDLEIAKKTFDTVDLSRLPLQGLIRLITRQRAVIHRVAGQHSVYTDQCEQISRDITTPYHGKCLRLDGVISSLRADIEAGYLRSHEELIHRELFADFLEMSQHLLDQEYKDAAAVIAGSSLEAHLRQLCQKAGVDIETETGSPKKADRLNNDLAAANVYSKLDHKSVTAWLDLRNKAAHGHYDQYQREQFALLLSGVRDFITRNPA
jgi:hypothetical protein